MRCYSSESPANTALTNFFAALFFSTLVALFRTAGSLSFSLTFSLTFLDVEDWDFEELRSPDMAMGSGVHAEVGVGRVFVLMLREVKVR